MEILRKLRWVLYPSVFIFMFLAGAYCSFPTSVLKDMVQTSVTGAAIGMGPRGYGYPEVSVKDVSLWRLSGINIDGLKIIWPPQKNDSPLVVDLDFIKGRLSIFSLLTSSKSFSGQLGLFSGRLSGNIDLRRQGALGALNLNGTNIDLAKATIIEALVGAPLTGLSNMKVNLRANSELSKDGTGSILFSINNAVFGPGSVNLPTGGFVSSLTVPQINLGNLEADLGLNAGQVESRTLKLSGGDLETESKLTISLGRRAALSRISGSGWFSVKKEFIVQNETIKMLFDLLPELKAAQQGDGKVGFAISGSLLRPQFKLETYVADKHIVKKGGVASRK